MGELRGNGGAPQLCAANPGVGTIAEIGFADGERTWSEDVDLVALAALECEKHDHETINHGDWLEHPSSGFAILPQFVSLEPMEEEAVRTVTTVQVNHGQLVPRGLFEYQHAWGKDAAASISRGFDVWVQMDFATLLDALRAEPQTCSVFATELPETEERPVRMRRALLGPTIHYMQAPGDESSDDEHTFCPCCLLTNSYETFRPLIEGDELLALRMFALRDNEGKVLADCRINGEDWEPGAEALRRYAETWPPAGYEHRKQYVVLQTVEV